MSRLVVPIAVLALFAGCASPEPAAPRTIAEFLQRHADDFAAGIDDPDVAVTWDYVEALVRAWDATEAAPGFRAWADGNVILSDEECREIGTRLRDALPDKRGAAILPSIGTLVRLGYGTGDGFRDAVLETWPDMDADTHEWLLRGSWEQLRRPEFEPVLRAEIAAHGERATPWHVDDTPSLALLRLSDLAPADARGMILADIRRKQPLFGGVALTALPDERLEEVEANFRRPHEELLHWSFDLEKHGPLAERYGGPAALATARALLDRPDQVKNPHLIRIVMSQDRTEGFRRLERGMAARGEKTYPRPGPLLSDVLGRNWIQKASYWGEDAAAFVRRYLEDEDPEVREYARHLLE